MAPLGEGSLEATILDGARGRPTPSHHLTSRWDKIFQPASDCPFAADPPIRAANGPRFTRIPRTTGGRAPGSRCARRGNAVVAGQTCGPGHPRGSRSQPRALRREGVRMRRVRTSTDAGTPGRLPWLLRPLGWSIVRDPGCTRRSGSLPTPMCSSLLLLYTLCSVAPRWSQT